MPRTTPGTLSDLVALGRTRPDIWYRPGSTAIALARIDVSLASADPEDWPAEFLRRFGRLFGAPAAMDEPTVTAWEDPERPLLRARLLQTIGGLEVAGALCDLSVDLPRRRIAVASTLLPVTSVARSRGRPDVARVMNRLAAALRTVGFLAPVDGFEVLDSHVGLWPTDGSGTQAREALFIRVGPSPSAPHLAPEGVVALDAAQVLGVRRLKLSGAADTFAGEDEATQDESAGAANASEALESDDFEPLVLFDVLAPDEAADVLALARDQRVAWPHVFVDVYRDPLASDIRAMAADGLRLLERLTPKRWRAAVRGDVTTLLRIAARDEVRRIAPIAVASKLAPRLRTEAGTASPRTMVRFHLDVALPAALARVERAARARTMDQAPLLHGATLRIAPRIVADVAALDEVKWVESAEYEAATTIGCDDDLREGRGYTSPIPAHAGLQRSLPPLPSPTPAVSFLLMDGYYADAASQTLKYLKYVPLRPAGQGGDNPNHGTEVLGVVGSSRPAPPPAVPQEFRAWYTFRLGIAPDEIDTVYDRPTLKDLEKGTLASGALKDVTENAVGTAEGASRRFVANMSIGSNSSVGRYSPHDEEMDGWVRERGVTVVVSAGNDSRRPAFVNFVQSPGLAKNVLTVGAYTCNGDI